MATTAKAKRPRPKLVRKPAADPLEKFEKVVVNVRLLDGGVQRVTCLRAARLLESGQAQPEGWSREDAQLVLEAHEARTQVQARRLRADGLLVGEGQTEPEPGPWAWLTDVWTQWR